MKTARFDGIPSFDGLDTKDRDKPARIGGTPVSNQIQAPTNHVANRPKPADLFASGKHHGELAIRDSELSPPVRPPARTAPVEQDSAGVPLARSDARELCVGRVVAGNIAPARDRGDRK